MTNSEWLSWFLYIEPWWLAPIRIYVYSLFIVGVIIIGCAKGNLRYVLIGLAFFAGLIFLIITSRPNLKGFFEFNLLSVKLLYSFAIIVMVIVMGIAVHIRKNVSDDKQSGA